MTNDVLGNNNVNTLTLILNKIPTFASSSGAIASQETRYGFYDHNENVPLVIRAECGGGGSELTIDLPLGSRESQTVLVYRDGAGEVKLYPAHKMDQIQKDNSDPMPFVRSASSD